ncbi:hypothetical protein RP20_CCG012393 [Aedes albopictus]|nr:hypothetical protein RP20_CCG012393 [Aedes albopictus]
MCQVNTDPMRSRKGYLQVVGKCVCVYLCEPPNLGINAQKSITIIWGRVQLDRVEVPPAIVESLTSNDMVVREGTNVTLTCKAKGFPEPYVMWRREDGDEMAIGGENVNVVDGEVLHITRVSRLHMAAYLCVASNGVPPSISKRVQLRVQFPPMLSIPSQLEGAYLGQDVILECHTEAYPASINYWTTERGDMIISAKRSICVTTIHYHDYRAAAVKYQDCQLSGDCCQFSLSPNLAWVFGAETQSSLYPSHVFRMASHITSIAPIHRHRRRLALSPSHTLSSVIGCLLPTTTPTTTEAFPPRTFTSCPSVILVDMRCCDAMRWQPLRWLVVETICWDPEPDGGRSECQ